MRCKNGQQMYQYKARSPLQKQGLSKMKKGLSMPDLTQAEPEATEEESWPQLQPESGARGSEEAARPSFLTTPPPHSSRPPSFNLRQPGRTSFSHRPTSPPAPEPSRTGWTLPSQTVSLYLSTLSRRNSHHAIPNLGQIDKQDKLLTAYFACYSCTKKARNSCMKTHAVKSKVFPTNTVCSVYST